MVQNLNIRMWLWLTIILLLTIYLYFRWTVRNLLRADEMFPGPTKIPIFGNALEIMWNRKDLHKYGENFFYFHRRSIRLWILHKLFVVLIEPRDIEKVYGNMDHITKADQYNYILDWIGFGLLTSFGTKWRKHRKILTPAFHFKILEHFIEIFHHNGTIFMEKLSEKAGKGNFDCYDMVKLYALDNIAEAAMGTKVNAQIYPQGEYVKSVKVMCEVVFTRIISPWLWPNFLFKLSSHGRKHDAALKCIHGLTNEVIAKRKEEMKFQPDDDSDDEMNIKKRRVFLDILLRSTEEGGLTNEEMREEVDTFMFEGHDTITSAISFALHSLAEHPECQDRAYQEVMDIFGDSDRSETYQDLQSMKYLEMVIKETLRWYPSVPIMGRQIEEDIVLDERATIPKGSQVLVIVPAVHRWFWWEKRTEFYPEHFDPESSAKRHPFQFLPFSAGPRNCIGQRFAMLEMKATLSRVLRNYKLLPADPPVPLHLVVDLIMVSSTGVNIRVERRNKRLV